MEVMQALAADGGVVAYVIRDDSRNDRDPAMEMTSCTISGSLLCLSPTWVDIMHQRQCIIAN